MDGKYMTVISSPIGEIKGSLTLKTNGTNLSGQIEALGMKNSFTNGYVNNNRCKFSGKIQTPMGNITYEAQGVLNGTEMTIVANTNMGKFEFKGKKMM